MGICGRGLIGAALLMALGLLAGCDTPPGPPTSVAALSPLVVTATPLPVASPTRLPPTATAVQQAALAPTRQPPPTEAPWVPPPTQGPIYQIGSLSFADEQHGWVLGTTCTPDYSCSIAMRATTDSGESWSPVPAGPHDVSTVRLVTADVGWVYNPGLFVTRDGGKTWRDDNPGLSVVAVAPVGKSVWALETVCATDESCPLFLRSSTDQGLTWEPHPVQLPILGSLAQIVRLSTQDAWVLGYGLAATHDGGQTWQQLPAPPCGAGRAPFAGVGEHELWLLCSGGGATIMELKRLYISPDGGQHWDLVAAASLHDLQNFPIVGHISSMLLTAPAHGWVVLQRGTLIRSLNGGKTWDAAIPYGVANPGDAGFGPLVSVDDLHLWLAAQGRIFRTTNGGATWDEREVFPPWYPPGLR